jgi:hypothetical protein
LYLDDARLLIVFPFFFFMLQRRAAILIQGNTPSSEHPLRDALTGFSHSRMEKPRDMPFFRCFDATEIKHRAVWPGVGALLGVEKQKVNGVCLKSQDFQPSVWKLRFRAPLA